MTEPIKSKLLKLSTETSPWFGIVQTVVSVARRKELVILSYVKRASLFVETSEYRPAHTGTTVTRYGKTRKCFAPTVDALQLHYVGHVLFSETALPTSTTSCAIWTYDLIFSGHIRLYYVVRPCNSK